MIHKLEHIGVVVKDIEASIAFYTSKMGLCLVKRAAYTEDIELAFLSFAGSEDVCIELIGGSKEEYPDEGKVNHIAFTVSDIETEIVRLRELGVQLFDDEAKEVLDGVKVAFFADPDGGILELFQPGRKI